MKKVYLIVIIFLVCLNSIKAEFTLYNYTGKPIDIQFFYGNKPANTVMHIPAVSEKSQGILPWKLIIPSFKLFKRRSFLIASEGLNNVLTFGPYWSWCTDKTFVIRAENGLLTAGPSDKD